MGTLYLFGLLVALVLMGLTLRLFIQDRVPLRAFLFWEMVAAVLVVFSVFPRVIDWLMAFVGVNHRAYFMLTLGLLGLYFIAYNVFMTQRKIEKDLMRFAQAFALFQYQKEMDSSGTPADESAGNNSSVQ